MGKISFLPIIVMVFMMVNLVMDCDASCEEITLGVGESKVVGDKGLQVGFIEISLDCRCPEGLLCFWEGDAVAELWADLPSREALYFELHSNNGFEWQIKYDDYLISLIIVEPYPHKDRTIDPNEYTVTLDISNIETSDQGATWGTIKTLLVK